MDFGVIAWLILMLAFIVIEIVTLGLTTVWFAGGALAAMIAALLKANVPIQISLFLLVSFVLLFVTRPVAVRYLNQSREKTNAAGLIGRTCIVKEEIDNLKAMGCVVIDGQEWTARCPDDKTVIQKDKLVVIQAIQGVKLIVKEKEE